MSENAHSPDFRWCRRGGQEFFLSENQAQVLRVLWTADADTPGVVLCDRFILREAALNSVRLRDAFRGSDAWGKLILPAAKPGYRRLA